MKKTKLLVGMTAALMIVSSAAPTVFADKWVETENGYVYEYDDGTKAENGWLEIDGSKYYIQKDGTRKTGWLKTSSGKKYYFGKDGVMYKSKWLTLKSGNKYYLNSKGVAVTGFKTISDNKYYFSKDGVMKTGWVKSGDSRYYFKKDGTMARNCKMKISGTTYSFDEDGKSTEEINTTPAEFVIPYAGDSRTKVIKNCGIANYDYDAEDNSYEGEVLYCGVEATVMLSFNEEDKLYSYAIIMPCSYTMFSTMISGYKKSLGNDYSYSDGSYMWVSFDKSYDLNESVNISYKNKVFSLLYMNFKYL